MGIEALGRTGKQLLEDLSLDGDSFGIGVLILEACRIADRLEKLDSLLSGDENTWLTLENGRDGVLEVRVDGALQESRQQTTVLRQLLAEIARQRGSAHPGSSDDDDLADL